MPSKEIITMQNELKPCPFCGAIPSLRQMKSTKEYYLFCRKCYIETTGFTDKKEIIKYWNARFNEINCENIVTKSHKGQTEKSYSIGDRVYCVNGYGSQRYIEEFTVAEIRITEDGIWLTDTKGMEWLARVCHFSRESAEKDLKAQKGLIDIVNENFKKEDIIIHFTYEHDKTPQSEEVRKDMENYIRRLKERRKNSKGNSFFYNRFMKKE